MNDNINKVNTTNEYVSVNNSKLKGKNIIDKYTDYHLRMFKNMEEKQYDKGIVNLYKKGKIVFEDKTYEIYDFYINYNFSEGLLERHFTCSKEDYSDILLKSKEQYNCFDIIQLRDTTAFIEILNSDASYFDPTNNTIKLIDESKILEIINNWNGMIHDKVPETDAVENKDLKINKK